MARQRTFSLMEVVENKGLKMGHFAVSERLGEVERTYGGPA